MRPSRPGVPLSTSMSRPPTARVPVRSTRTGSGTTAESHQPGAGYLGSAAGHRFGAGVPRPGSVRPGRAAGPWRPGAGRSLRPRLTRANRYAGCLVRGRRENGRACVRLGDELLVRLPRQPGGSAICEAPRTVSPASSSVTTASSWYRPHTPSSRRPGGWRTWAMPFRRGARDRRRGERTPAYHGVCYRLRDSPGGTHGGVDNRVDLAALGALVRRSRWSARRRWRGTGGRSASVRPVKIPLAR